MTDEAKRDLDADIRDIYLRKIQALEGELASAREALKNIRCHSEDGVLEGLDYADFLHTKRLLGEANARISQLLFRQEKDAENSPATLALRNVLRLCLTRRYEIPTEVREHLVRFCAEGGVKPTILRGSDNR